MSKHIGTIGHYTRVDACGAGVAACCVGSQALYSPTDARALAALLIQAADEVERMRAERAEFTHEGIAAPGNPRFDRGG